MDKQTLIRYSTEVQQELHNILDWWATHMPDKEGEGFYGSIDAKGNINPDAPRGLVMYSRILWTFSAAYRRDKNKRWLQVAERAFNYMSRYFTDKEQGGMYWSVDRAGNVIEDKKQVYGLAFAIYGLSEFHSATGNGNAMLVAIDLYKLIEQYNETTAGGGYLEAFSRDWKPLADLRLSEKDANEKKSMNTHLHVLEAYTNLYRAWKNEKLAKAIRKLLQVFDQYIIDKKKYTQQLFFNEAWEPRSSIVSYGHDIEASWLLYEAAEVLEDESLTKYWGTIAIKMADAASAGVDKDGGTWYEKEHGQIVREKHWWPQAEAMVGYLNAYGLSKKEHYLRLSLESFSFIKDNLLDTTHGEWFWGIYDGGRVMQKEKAGFWKCPYHNGRACMEVTARLQKIINNKSQVVECL